MASSHYDGFTQPLTPIFDWFCTTEVLCDTRGSVSLPKIRQSPPSGAAHVWQGLAVCDKSSVPERCSTKADGSEVLIINFDPWYSLWYIEPPPLWEYHFCPCHTLSGGGLVSSWWQFCIYDSFTFYESFPHHIYVPNPISPTENGRKITQNSYELHSILARVSPFSRFGEWERLIQSQFVTQTCPRSSLSLRVSHVVVSLWILDMPFTHSCGNVLETCSQNVRAMLAESFFG